ncbi:hypothetical protein SOVF_070090 [Spinacia oleracea]|nr:hypothetical protein SOVF_070090 [Spinacia oleracea]
MIFSFDFNFCFWFCCTAGCCCDVGGFYAVDGGDGGGAALRLVVWSLLWLLLYSGRGRWLEALGLSFRWLLCWCYCCRVARRGEE